MSYLNWIRSKVGNNTIFLNFSGACITNAKGEVLLQRRGDKNKWGLPGGIIELGESAEDAVKREVKEETGLEVCVNHLIGVYTKYFDSYPNGDKAQTITLFFKCNITGGQLESDDIESLELKYFKPQETPALVNDQHEDLLKDFINNERGIYR